MTHIHLTTTIPYVNAAPHLGFALEAVQADVLARHHRARGAQVWLQTGTDDNSLKNVGRCSGLRRSTIGPVTINAAAPVRRFAAWLSPLRVALLGVVVVALLLLLPISVPEPGDHDAMAGCGNALEVDVVPPVGLEGSEYHFYWAEMFERCTTARITRIAQAVGVVSVTLLVMAFMATRMQRRRSFDEPSSPRRPSQAQPDDL
jgi:hypothetical protein